MNNNNHPPPPPPPFVDGQDHITQITAARHRSELKFRKEIGVIKKTGILILGLLILIPIIVSHCILYTHDKKYWDHFTWTSPDDDFILFLMLLIIIWILFLLWFSTFVFYELIRIPECALDIINNMTIGLANRMFNQH